MAARTLPPRTLKGTYKRLDVTKYRKLVNATQTFRRLTVVWCNNQGVPYNTTGFFAVARERNGAFIQSVRFDSFGVAVFTALATPLRRSIVLRTFDRNGNLFRTRIVPAGVAAFVIIP